MKQEEERESNRASSPQTDTAKPQRLQARSRGVSGVYASRGAARVARSLRVSFLRCCPPPTSSSRTPTIHSSPIMSDDDEQDYLLEDEDDFHTGEKLSPPKANPLTTEQLYRT